MAKCAQFVAPLRWHGAFIRQCNHSGHGNNQGRIQAQRHPSRILKPFKKLNKTSIRKTCGRPHPRGQAKIATRMQNPRHCRWDMQVLRAVWRRQPVPWRLRFRLWIMRWCDVHDWQSCCRYEAATGSRTLESELQNAHVPCSTRMRFSYGGEPSVEVRQFLGIVLKPGRFPQTSIWSTWWKVGARNEARTWFWLHEVATQGIAVTKEFLNIVPLPVQVYGYRFPFDNSSIVEL